MQSHLIMKSLAVLVPVALAAAALRAGEPEERPRLRKVAIGGGVELNYIERGQGVPVIFIHGTLGDYSVWESQLGPFAATYRAVAYSRRYNYPNSNTLEPKHSAVVEAEDLAALIKTLGLEKVHLVGHSYGGYAALLLAIKHPELVRTLTLAEPPVVFAGDKLDETKQRVIEQARAAFKNGNAEDAVRAIVDSTEPGKYDKIPKPFHALLLRNAPELKALVTSTEMYPPLDRDRVRKLTVPTLLLSGEKSPRSLKSATDELERLLPEMGQKRVTIADADHGMWFQQPDACRSAVLEFLRGK